MKLFKAITWFFIALTFSAQLSFAQVSSIEAEYQKGSRCYAKRKVRTNTVRNDWLPCLTIFSEIHRKHPKSNWGDDALYSEARLRRELHKRYAKQDDLKLALQKYNQVIKEYPKSNFADDALFQIAKLRVQTSKDTTKATRALNVLLERYPQGDMQSAAKKMLASLQQAQPTKALVQPLKKPTKLLATPVKTKEPKAKELKSFSESRFALNNKKVELFEISSTSLSEADEITLELSDAALYTTANKPFGKRTKSPGELILDLIQTKAANDLAKTQAFQAKYVSKVDIKKRFIQGGLALHFELKPGAAYKVSSEGKQIKIRFFKSTSANAKISQFAAKQKKSSGKQLRIIIDPGHGGEDSGAVGKNGSKEKDVVLQISKRLAADLRRKLNAKVYLTRSWDKTLTLEERNTFAKNKAADLFLSVHANASPKREVSGIQTYYLNNATDQASIRLAKRENRNSHQKLPKEKHVLSTMLQNYATEESHLLAKQVQNSLIKSLSKKYKDVHDLNVRSALFYVLVGAKCPGVLIETSFISNPREEQRLQNSRYQAALSSAITDGVAQYLRQQSKQRETL